MPKDPDIIEMVQDKDGTYILDTRKTVNKKHKTVKPRQKYKHNPIQEEYNEDDEIISTGIPNIDNFLNGFEIGNHIFERFENILKKGMR